MISPKAKSGLAERTLDAAEKGASERPDQIGVCFDPDGDAPGTEFSFFQKDFARCARGRAGELRHLEGGRLTFRMRNRDVLVAPGPWRGDHGWKRAFRIWNAAVKPDAEAFVDGLLQEPSTRGACLDALKETRAAQVLFELALPPP
jgi:hypothetical protein